jgi:enediyne polyketide synthase
MGERLGVLESLTREGISPISLDGGLEILRQVLASPHAPGSMVVMGRAGGLPTISLEPRDLPLTRFIDQPRVYYPGIELVADVELSATSDPYLADHLLDGDLLFPAVLGMEAMAQAGAALAGAQEPPLFEDMEFLRPIVVPADGSAVVRIAAVNRGDSVVVAIRTADTGFQADHFRATLRYGAERHFSAEQIQLPSCANLVPLDPEADLYGPVLFQGRRFQRLTGYRRLAATSCTAEISTGPQDEWFASYLPGDLLLGNPGSRDAFMHAIQCCVPNATLLPAGVERLYPAPASSSASSWELILCAKERGRVGDTFTYDLDVCAIDGRILERWEGLRLQAVRKTDGRGPWVPALLGPYLERQAAELLPCAARVVVEPAPALVPGDADGAPCAHSDAAGDAGTSGDVARRRRQTDAAVSRMLGRPTVVTHRGDGKPEVADAGVGLGVSASHADGVTLAVMGAGRVGCDAETVRDLPAADWRDLLGAEQFALAELVSRERGEDLAVAATRVWGAVECLRKVGRVLPGPVIFSRSGPDGWVLFQSGQAGIASFATRLRDEPGPVVFTILTEG